MIVCEQVWLNGKAKNRTESTQNVRKGDDGIPGRCSAEESTYV